MFNPLHFSLGLELVQELSWWFAINHQGQLRISLGSRLLVAVSLSSTLQPSQNVGVCRNIFARESSHGGEWEDVHDVRGGELVTHQPLIRLEVVVHKIQELGKLVEVTLGVPLFGIDVSMLQDHNAAQLRVQVAVGEMKPVQVLGVVLVRGIKGQLAVAVLVNDVLRDGTALGESHIAVLNNWRLANWVQVLD